MALLVLATRSANTFKNVNLKELESTNQDTASDKKKKRFVPNVLKKRESPQTYGYL